MRLLPMLVLAAGSLVRAAQVPVYTVQVFKADSVRLAPSAVRITGVRDLRVLGASDPRLLGSCAVGVFQERMTLRAADPVELSVLNLLGRWVGEEATDSVKPDSLRPPPVRVEILSFESWTVPTTNPAKASARVRLRVLADGKDWKGRIAEVEGGADRDGLNTPEEQAELLRLSLRKAMLAFLGQEWRKAQPLPSAGEPGPAPDPWTDALKRAAALPASAARTLAHASLSWGAGGVGAGVRGIAYYEPETAWNREYWALARLRDPLLSGGGRFSEPWVGELGGGVGWQRRLGAGGSDLVLVHSAGALLGLERFDRRSGETVRRDGGAYVGVEGRTALRYEPAGIPGLSGEAGAQAALRLPSSIQAFDLGLVLEAGWRF